jgi:Ca2+-binding EF-hand superfamily protein
MNRAESDTNQSTTNSHIIAARIIKRGGLITHHDINAVLGQQGHTITEAELAELVAIPYNTYSFLNFKEIVAALKLLYPKMPKSKGQ